MRTATATPLADALLTAPGAGRPPACSGSPLPNVRPTDPHTSHQAAPTNPGRESMQDLVRKILEAHPEGLTDWELFELTGLEHHQRASVIKRRGDCGAVDSGFTRPGPSGRECVVWVLR